MPTAKDFVPCHHPLSLYGLLSFQILPSQIQTYNVIKAYFWSACWLRLGNGAHIAASSPKQREGNKGFAMQSWCNSHSKTNWLDLNFSISRQLKAFTNAVVVFPFNASFNTSLLYLLTHHINGSPLYLRTDGRITVNLPIASCFLPDPSLFSQAQCFKEYLCSSSSKSSSEVGKLMHIIGLNWFEQIQTGSCNSRVVEGQPESTLRRGRIWHGPGLP